MSQQYGKARGNLVPWMEEGFIEYGIGAFVILARVFTRCVVRGGPRKWQGDDWLILVALASYTTALYGLYMISLYGLNISKKVNDAAGPQQAKEIELGSKWQVVTWFSYLIGLTSVKGCLLFFYRRLTEGLWHKKKLWTASAICLVASFVIGIVIICTNCIPFKLHWQVKPHPGACTLGIREYYAIGITGIVTDLLMVAIPLPLLWGANFSLARKLFLIVLLCGGLFVIIATFLRAFFSIYGGYLFLKYQPASYKVSGFIIAWAMRENTVAVIVVNAPCITPLFTKRVWRGLCAGSRKRIIKNDAEQGDLRPAVFPRFANPNASAEKGSVTTAVNSCSHTRSKTSNDDLDEVSNQQSRETKQSRSSSSRTASVELEDARTGEGDEVSGRSGVITSKDSIRDSDPEDGLVATEQDHVTALRPPCNALLSAKMEDAEKDK